MTEVRGAINQAPGRSASHNRGGRHPARGWRVRWQRGEVADVAAGEMGGRGQARQRPPRHGQPGVVAPLTPVRHHVDWDKHSIPVLHQHADLLARATDTTRRLATISPADPRPVAQAQVIRQHLAATRRTGTPVPVLTALDVAARLPALATALDDATGRQLDRGHGLTPVGDLRTDPMSWVKAGRYGDEPQITTMIGRAATQIHAQGAALIRGPVTAAVQSPRAVLATVMTEAGSAHRRPATTPGLTSRRR